MPSVYVKKYPNGRRQAVTCQQCGTTFSVTHAKLRQGGGKFCSLDCKHTSQRSRLQFTCECCGQSFERCPSDTKDARVRFCSWECRTVGIRGAGNPAWTGSDADYRGWDWKLARKKAIERDGYQCTQCGSLDRLVVHHITPWDVQPDNSLSNLETLCITCHMKHHKGATAA